MNTLRMFLCFIFLVAVGNGQTTVPKVGEYAPPLTLETILALQPVDEVTWEKLRGKAVVLEFWATWCGPCIEQIPHFNELVTKYSDQPIQFISITDEDKEKVTKFLAARPIAGWVALNPSRSQFKAYDVVGIPHTILVDRNGRIAGITNPSHVTDSVLADLVAGKPINVATPVLMSFSNMRQDSAGALLDILIRPSTSSNSGMSSGTGQFRALGMTLRSALANAYRIDPSRIMAGPWADETRYDIQVTTPSAGQSYLFPLLQQTMEAVFQIKVRRETQERDVLILTIPNGRTSALRETASTGGSSLSSIAGKFSAINQPIQAITRFLESKLQKIVIDETELAGKYDFIIQYDMSQPEAVVTAIREQFGMELTSARRPIEVLVVEKSNVARNAER